MQDLFCGATGQIGLGKGKGKGKGKGHPITGHQGPEGSKGMTLLFL
jgi:hypothetical protein